MTLQNYDVFYLSVGVFLGTFENLVHCKELEPE